MRIEKLPSGSYRARKTYNKKTYTIVLPYKPTEKELTIMFAEKFKNDGVKHNDGTFLHYATKYVESRINVVSPATVRTYNIKIDQLSDHFKSLQLNDIPVMIFKLRLIDLLLNMLRRPPSHYMVSLLRFLTTIVPVLYIKQSYLLPSLRKNTSLSPRK